MPTDQTQQPGIIAEDPPPAGLGGGVPMQIVLQRQIIDAANDQIARGIVDLKALGEVLKDPLSPDQAGLCILVPDAANAACAGVRKRPRIVGPAAARRRDQLDLDADLPIDISAHDGGGA